MKQLKKQREEVELSELMGNNSPEVKENPKKWGCRREMNKSRGFNIICYSLIVLGLIVIGAVVFLSVTPNHKPQMLQNTTLREIMKKEVAEVNLSLEAVCIDYANYYYKSLKQKYPYLDVRLENYVDICNEYSLCENSHAFIVVAGYGSECILDQHTYVCIDIL